MESPSRCEHPLVAAGGYPRSEDIMHDNMAMMVTHDEAIGRREIRRFLDSEYPSRGSNFEDRERKS